MSKLTTLDQMRDAALRSQGLCAQVARAASDAVEELDRTKADRKENVPCTIPAAGWEADGDAEGYPYRFDLEAPGVTAQDLARVFLAPSAVAGAKSCGLCPVCETLAGKIRLRAAQIPGAELAAEYRITDGEE